MSIVYHDNWEIKKGLKDAKRHQEKIDEAIRKNVRNVIGNESIITTQGKKKVRVPVRGLKDYKFIYGSKGGGGLGQGDAKPGDVIGRRQRKEKGEHIHTQDMEAEVEVDYLLDVMFEDLGLPWLDPKKKNAIEIPKGWKFEAISKKGVYSRIHKKRTMKEAIKRNVLFIQEIMEQTDCSYEIAGKALHQSKGDIEGAIKLIINEELDTKNEDIGFLIHDDDIRYKQITEDIEICSKAVVFALMDVSGSMTPEKKYLMKSLLFWMVSWLRKQYESVEIRFIQHTETAKEVDEDTFFHGGVTGGTLAESAFKKANYIIDTEYPLDEWNIYTIYCSDGEDWEPLNAILAIEDMILKKINMLSYVEIKPNEDYDYGFSSLLPELKKKWKFKEGSLSKDGKFWINKNLRFLLSVIKDKSHIWPCLQFMLGMNKERNIND